MAGYEPPAQASMAEEEGFEPPVPFGTAVFKTAALNHSATPPEEVSLDDNSPPAAIPEGCRFSSSGFSGLPR
jgi:hypothetical protein